MVSELARDPHIEPPGLDLSRRDRSFLHTEGDAAETPPGDLTSHPSDLPPVKIYLWRLGEWEKKRDPNLRAMRMR